MRVDEANAFFLCFGKSIVINDVLSWNSRIIDCKNRKPDNGSRFLDNRGTFFESNDFSELRGARFNSSPETGAHAILC